MAKKPIASVARDFADVSRFLQDQGIIPKTPPPELIANAKKIHGATYSLILWRFRLKNLANHGQVFIDEIASDALQVLPQILMGYSKPAKILLRGMIENTVRHIYFSDHPIEFQRMNREVKWYLSVDDLFDYCKNHPAFLALEPDLDAINHLRTLYSTLSAGIHGRTVRDLEMKLALKKIRYVEAAAAQEAENLRRCTQAMNFLLAVFHCARMRKFQEEDQRIILRTLPPKAREFWRGCT
jgi:hypothetical protein